MDDRRAGARRARTPRPGLRDRLRPKQGHPGPGEDLTVFEAHGLDRTSGVLDFGAGTGQFALAAARRLGHVTAIEPMLVTAGFQIMITDFGRRPYGAYTCLKAAG